MKRWTNEETKFLVTNYSKKGAKYCIDNLDKSRGSIYYKANKLGLKINSKTLSKISSEAAINRSDKSFEDYKVNPTNFISNFTKESTYILGLIWADGSICTNNFSNKITLACVREDMEKFYTTFNKTGNWALYLYDGGDFRPQGMVYTSNPPMCDFLLKHNYGPHNIKSASSILKLIPEHLRHYWFLGLVDGDGSFYVNVEKRIWGFSISSCYDQDWSYAEDLLKKLNIKYSVNREISKIGHKSSEIRIQNKPGIDKIGNYIYQNYLEDGIGLPRKYDKYLIINNIKLKYRSSLL